MIQKLLITLTILLALSGCQDAKENQASHDAKIAEQAKAELRAELKKEQEEKVLETQKNNKYAHIGITTEDGKVIIDTDKTKSYFQQMANQLKAHADKFAKDFEKGVIDDKEAGIEVNATHINIDLNKTKSFLDTWSKTIEGYAKEFKQMTETLDTSK